tara:strand:- start:346 stop:930 length:585 start_codon:yes stop_codon:yes gene_type:complete
LKIGILALQGDFHEHQVCFNKLNVETQLVRSVSDLNLCDSLVIPGGESTTISKLLNISNLDSEIIIKSKNGMPLWGTCAGLILISDKIIEEDPSPLKLINVKTSRNFYGRQVDSFVEKIDLFSDEIEFEAIFIRAPKIIEIGKNVDILATTNNNSPVAVQSKNILGTTFHPELTDDLRIHQHFIEMISNKNLIK